MKSKSSIFSNNKKAFVKYQISDRYNSGIVLSGSEVKAIKQGKMNLKDAFVQIKNGQVFLINAHIGQYSKDGQQNYQPKRDRKLLLNKSEINSLAGKLQKGITLVPLKAFLKNGFIKIEIGIAKAKKLFDRREELKKRTIEKQIQQDLKNI